MMRTLAFTTALALTAGAAFAQHPHSGHAGMHPQPSAASGIVTSPADGAMTHGSPERFNVTFPHPMMLRTVTLTMEDHAPIVVTAPEAPAALSVRAPLPRLAPGTYRAIWVAEAPDGHRMTGTVSFMVH
ncbi:copper resistance protein CopC [Campylobacter upsaliensis]|uniref:copper resistance CopC family protein n=1 Tax=Campylobacter upsaliensis TaxID=28080 RepID=UPI001BDB4DBE|nr:copper resistance CopC family protein [Campylobacter upsaliensis]MBT0801321.1 copper resistance protein CopC [Campylobacter upsaliensis]